MKRRILFLMPNWKALSENWMQGMMSSLGNNLVAICVWNNGLQTSWNKIPIISLTNFRTGSTRLLSYFFGKSIRITASKIVEETINKYKIDTVLVNYGDFALRFKDVWKNKSLKVFVHFHGYDVHLDLRKDNNSNAKYFPKLYKKEISKLSNYTTFIANSTYTKNILIKDFGIKSSKIRINYLGVSVPIRIKCKNNSKIQILQLGRLVDFKSPDRTIQAFISACDQGLDGKLIIAGIGILKKRCELLKRNSIYKKRIEILGAVDHEKAGTLLENTDIFTQHNIRGEWSHQTECLGVSILEAMSYGIPVVGTKSGGVVETVVDGKTGILVKPGNIKSQADAFLKLANNPELRRKMGIEGRKRVIKLFSLKKESGNLFRIINE